jgi:alcohol dehydrogenase
VIVRPVASTTCDLDRAIIAGATPFQGPFAIGHECVAEVVDVGDDAGVIPGARVVVPWHPCCTVCAACLQGRMADCERVPRFAMYGVPLGGDFGGLFDDLVHVPFGAALVPVPDGVAPASVASASDNLSDAYGAVSRALATRPQGSVLVLGGTGSIGQWAAGWAVMLGAARAVYVDRDEETAVCQKATARRRSRRSMDWTAPMPSTS